MRPREFGPEKAGAKRVVEGDPHSCQPEPQLPSRSQRNNLLHLQMNVALLGRLQEDRFEGRVLLRTPKHETVLNVRRSRPNLVCWKGLEEGITMLLVNFRSGVEDVC